MSHREVKAVSDADTASWNAYVVAHPMGTALATTQAMKWWASNGWTLQPLALREGGAVVAGAALCLTADYQAGCCGFSAIGRIGKSSEAVAEEACRQFADHHRSDATVDVHLADQLLLATALAHGRSEFRTGRVTRHLLTNAHVIRQFIPARIEIDAGAGQPGTVLVDGIGLD